MRADARSNRDQIVAAAQVVFLEQGVEVSMKEIADRAGVGVGTLYRRFPDRGALISAAAHAYLSGLADLAATAIRDEEDAWSTLCRFLRECAEMRLGALASAIEPTLHADIRSDPALTEVRARIADHVEDMTTRARASGDLRADVGPRDIAALMTLQVFVFPDESYVETARRTMDIVLAGLRAR
ncbi:TetR/AcrR family transcriptional regulator [Nocardia miyunensis]|uniref:TetR/AcrR family transcriptional regulator n=1 Tax=Nocardia miyunensis TaxID=282684 RepID=UPI00082DF7ED|nr:TetR/AcrR family transcriptional regulator [Nocardia miyunensis]